jgi:hypothetical protein
MVANDPGACSALVSFGIIATDNQPGVTYSYQVAGFPITSPGDTSRAATTTRIVSDVAAKL